MLPSLTLLSIISTSSFLTMASKYPEMSASSTHPIGRRQMILPTSLSASCWPFPGRNPYERRREIIGGFRSVGPPLVAAATDSEHPAESNHRIIGRFTGDETIIGAH